MKLKHKLLTVLLSPIVYLLRDEFTTPQAAPLTSPRTAEPGPGTLTSVQLDGQFSINANGQLVFPGQSTPVLGDLGFYGTGGFARLAGRALLSSFVETTANRIDFCWHNATTLSTASKVAMFILSGGSLIGRNQSGQVDLGGGFFSNTTYSIALVELSTGAEIFIRGGAFTNWTLLFRFIDDSSATLYPIFTDNDGIGTLDYFRIRDLGGAFATDNGIATLNVATAISGTNYAADADGLYDLAFTLPAGSANLVAVELRYRQQDATNYWTAYIKRNAGNTAWDFFLDSVTAGTPTNRLTVTGVGTPDMIRVIADGLLHDCYTKVTTTWTKRGSEISNASFQTQSTLDPIAGAGTTLGAIQGWARRSALYNGLSAV